MVKAEALLRKSFFFAAHTNFAFPAYPATGRQAAGRFALKDDL
jgi:hypothetical protein